MHGDVTRRCIDCHADFTLSAEHAQWFDVQGFDRPKRCDACRRLRKTKKAAESAADGTPHRRGMETR